MVATFGLDQLTIVRILVDLNLPRLALSYLRCCYSRGSVRGLRIQNVDDVAQAVAIVFKQATNFFLKLYLFFKSNISFSCFPALRAGQPNYAQAHETLQV